MTQSSSKVRRLHFIDNPTTSAIPYNFTDPQSPVFQNLTDLNLCLDLANDKAHPNNNNARSCLQRARNLERLRVWVNKPFDLTPGIRYGAEAMAALFNTSTRHWPKLTTLELAKVSTNPVRRFRPTTRLWPSGSPTTDSATPIVEETCRAFLGLLGAHSPTLRSLTLQECEVYPDII